MSAAFIYCGGRLTAYISGELDHHSAKEIRLRIDSEIQKRKPQVLAIDFSKVTFMDSSGIGLVMGRYKLVKEYGGEVVIENPPPPIKRVMQISGIGRLAKIVNNPDGKPPKNQTVTEKEENKNETDKGQADKPDENPVSESFTE